MLDHFLRIKLLKENIIFLITGNIHWAEVLSLIAIIIKGLHVSS